jgi:hypothetical protein
VHELLQPPFDARHGAARVLVHEPCERVQPVRIRLVDRLRQERAHVADRHGRSCVHAPQETVVRGARPGGAHGDDRSRSRRAVLALLLARARHVLDDAPADRGGRNHAPCDGARAALHERAREPVDGGQIVVAREVGLERHRCDPAQRGDETRVLREGARVLAGGE